MPLLIVSSCQCFYLKQNYLDCHFESTDISASDVAKRPYHEKCSRDWCILGTDNKKSQDNIAV